MIIELREIVQEDIKTIKPWLTDKENAKWLDSFFQNEKLTDEQLALFLMKRDKKTYMVLYQGVPVGIAGLTEIDEINQSAHIWDLLGNKAYRKRGIIKAANMLVWKKAFFELNLHSVNSWITEDNVFTGVMRTHPMKTIGRQRECHMVDGVLKDRILFDLLKDEFDESALYQLIENIK